MVTLKQFLQQQRELFTEKNVESAALSADILLAKALGLDRDPLLKLLILEPDKELQPDVLETFSVLSSRRLAGEPVAYILGYREFFGRKFMVNPSVLIPRPETELIIDTAMGLLLDKAFGRFADLGTGSGCIAATLALELGPGWKGLALDNSQTALSIAWDNAHTLKADKQIEFIPADFREYIFQSDSFDLIVSNPPYISSDEYEALEVGVKKFEPKNALVPSGAEHALGDEDLVAIASQAADALKSDGILIMEMGCDQGRSVRSALAKSTHWRELRTLKDMAGLERLVMARKN